LHDNEIVLFVHNDRYILESETCCKVMQLLFLLLLTLCLKYMFALFMVLCLFMAGKQNQAVNLICCWQMMQRQRGKTRCCWTFTVTVCIMTTLTLISWWQFCMKSTAPGIKAIPS